MSQYRIKQHNYDYNKAYTCIANRLFKDTRLSAMARFILMFYFSNSVSWQIFTPVTAKDLGISKDLLIKYNKELYEKGYIRRTRQRKEDGVLGGWDYEYDIDPVFNNPPWDEHLKPPKEIVKKTIQATVSKKEIKGKAKCCLQVTQPSPEKSTMVNPSMVTATLPIPNKPIPKGYAYKKAMPTDSSSPKEMVKAPPRSKSRIHKRPEEQENRYQYLLGLEFGSKKERLSEDTASYLAHKYSQNHIDDCYYDLQGKLLRKQNIRNPIALFITLLKSESCPRGKNCTTNQAYAEQIQKDLAWSSLKIESKYVYDVDNPSKDVPLNIDPESFRASLMGLYGSFRGL